MEKCLRRPTPTKTRPSAKGSDGSHVTLYEHHHFTVNANGDVSIEFDKVRATC